MATGALAMCLVSAGLLAGSTASSAATICPPPPCEQPVIQGGQIICPLKTDAAIATYPCGCPVAVTGTVIPIPVDGCVDLAVTESVDRATATVGDRLTYTVQVRNNGPDTALDSNLADTLPTGLAFISGSGPAGACATGPPVSCALGSLGPGEATTATIVARATQAGDLSNTAAATSSGLDSDPSNDQATAITHVNPPPEPKAPNTPASRYCSASGDVCYGVFKKPLRLRLALAARYFRRYSLCLKAPTGANDCRRFRVHRRRHGTWGSAVRWRQAFPNRGHGTYTATWSTRSGPLGPVLTFTR